MTDLKEKIGRSTYLIQEGDKKVIMKYEPLSTGGLLQKISRKLFKGSLPFKNEIYINNLLRKQNFHSFRYPSSVYNNENSCLRFNIINGKETRNLSLTDKEKIVSSLIEFSHLAAAYENKGISGQVFRLIESPTVRTIKLIIFTKHNLTLKYKALYLLLSFIIKKRRNGFVLLHNDLKCKNIIKTKENDIYFIDFEDVTKEKVMVLTDIVNVLFDYKTCKINKHLLNKYWQQVLLLPENKEKSHMISEHLRVCLLSIAMSTCPNQESTFKNTEQRKLFLMTILNDKKFNSWWLNCGSITIQRNIT